MGHDSILLIAVLERKRIWPSLGYIVSSGTTRATKKKKQNNFSLLYMRGFPSYVCVCMHVYIHIYVHTHILCIWYTRGDQKMASELIELEMAVNSMFWEMNLGERQVLSQALSHFSSPLVVLVCGSACLFRNRPSQYTPHCLELTLIFGQSSCCAQRSRDPSLMPAFMELSLFTSF